MKVDSELEGEGSRRRTADRWSRSLRRSRDSCRAKPKADMQAMLGMVKIGVDALERVGADAF
jgi:hypothetical protein